jgi:hypothetical protein
MGWCWIGERKRDKDQADYGAARAVDFGEIPL